jgi:hypothetical protein
MMPSGHKAFVVSNVKDVELLLMHNKTYAAECVFPRRPPPRMSQILADARLRSRHSRVGKLF